MKTGFNDLDDLIDLENNNLIVIAGAMSIGKTSFALSIVNNVLKQDKGVLLFNLEMSKEKIKDSLIAQEGFIELEKIRDSKLNNEEIEKYKEAKEKLKESKLYINDTPRNYNRTNRRRMYQNETREKY